MPSSYASFRQRLPPTAPSHAVACFLSSPSSSSSSYPTSRGLLLSHLVTARGDTLQIWEVRSPDSSESAPSSSSAQSSPQLFHLQSNTLFGTITGVQATRTIESEDDGKDRLIISFKDAKIALLEWDELGQTLATVSIHTYERTSQVVSTYVYVNTLTIADRIVRLLLSLRSRTGFRTTSNQFYLWIPRIDVHRCCCPRMHWPSCLSPRLLIWTSWTTLMTLLTFMAPAMPE